MRTLFAITFILVSTAMQAAEYYNQKWFDYPDPATAPKSTAGCGNQACTDIPEMIGFPPKIRMRRQCVCISPTVKTEVLHRDVRVVVSGPDTSEKSVRDALVGYVAECVTTAMAASTPSPQLAASQAQFYSPFRACIAALSASGPVRDMLNQLDIHLDTSDSHWQPL